MKIRIEDSDGKKKYWVNDVPYDRIEDIPAEFQQHFIDKNNNGMPDQFDGLMDSVGRMKDGGSFFKEMFKMAKEDFKTSTQSTPTPKTSTKIDGYSSGVRESPAIPTIVKLLIGVLIVLLIAWVLPKFIGIPSLFEMNGNDNALSVNDSINSPTGMKVVLDDPDKPPYGMIGIVFDKDVKLFSFKLPDGAVTVLNDGSMQMQVAMEAGTNLEESVFSLLFEDGECVVGEGSTKVTLGKIEFNKSHQADSAAGDLSYRYSFLQNGKCLTFLLTLHSGNPEAYDPPVKLYDPNEQVAEIEKVLGAIKSY